MAGDYRTHVVLAVFILGSSGFAPVSSAADPATLRLGYGAAAEEQLYVLLAKPEIGANYGKTYKLDASRFQSSTSAPRHLKPVPSISPRAVRSVSCLRRAKAFPEKSSHRSLARARAASRPPITSKWTPP